jgi:hypothetical protein
MKPGKSTLAAAAALFALTAFDGAAEAREASGFGSNPQMAYCHWYKQKAMNTGDEYWWWRWRQCIRGWDWN